MAQIFDFIIVGGGTAGPVIANRLANSSTKPKVLLLEGGGSNNDDALRHPDLRFGAFMNPELNYGYKSIPQPQLDGREIQCPRGRGLGGSSAINFCCWLLGHKEDFNQWADVVGDDAWKWDGQGGVKERFRKIEALHTNLDDEQATIVSKKAVEEHSKTGMVDLSYNQVWPELEWLSFKAATEFGKPLNSDMNSGDPTGFGLAPTTYYRGLRITGATAYLVSPPSNLTVLANNIVSRVLFDGKTAVGVETLYGKQYHATKEVILSAGTFDSAKILLLSGVGPETELLKNSIPIIHNLPSVGKNMIDHCYVSTTILLKPKEGIRTEQTTSIVPDPLEMVGPQCPMAWLSSPTVKSSPEFLALPNDTQAFLHKVPSFEFITSNNPIGVGVAEKLSPGDQVISFIGAAMNSQSTAGSITLASSNPADPPLIDVGYVAHPYDRRVAIEALRAVIEYSKMPTFAAITEKRIEGPASDSEGDLFEHVKKSLSPVYHFAGTCRMGRDGDEKTVVDTGFRVKGVKGLRVADLSVAPLMINNHTQSTAYLIGETAAEKVIAEYGL